MNWKKLLKIVFWILFIPIIVFVAFVLIIFHYIEKDLCSEVETQRLMSPDRKIDAVVIEADCGATTSVTQRLYLVKHGEQSTEKMVAFFDGAVINDNEINSSKYGIIVKWKSSGELVIQYSDAKRVGMDHSIIKVGNEKIHLELDAGK